MLCLRYVEEQLSMSCGIACSKEQLTEILLVCLLDRNTDRDQVLQSALLCARDKFGIMYSTVQIELYVPESMASCASCQPPK